MDDGNEHDAKGLERRFMARPRRQRFRWVVVVGSLVGLFISITGIAQLYVATTSKPMSVPRNLHFVETGSYATRYEAWGKPTKHSIVLLHGAFESVATWVPLARVLQKTNHVEAYDLKGYGYTDHVGPYTVDALSQQLEAFLHARHLVHAVLVGHSLGAGVIAAFVLKHPTEAAGMVFLDGDGLSMDYPGRAFQSLLIEPYRSALFRSVVRSNFLLSTIFSTACGPECRPLTSSELQDLRWPLLVAGAEQALLGYMEHPIVGVSRAQREQLGRLRLPARVIAGREDSVLPPIEARRTATVLHAPPPTEIVGAGHLALWSDPVAVAKPIQELLTELG